MNKHSFSDQLAMSSVDKLVRFLDVIKISRGIPSSEGVSYASLDGSGSTVGHTVRSTTEQILEQTAAVASSISPNSILRLGMSKAFLKVICLLQLSLKIRLKIAWFSMFNLKKICEGFLLWSAGRFPKDNCSSKLKICVHDFNF